MSTLPSPSPSSVSFARVAGLGLALIAAGAGHARAQVVDSDTYRQRIGAAATRREALTPAEATDLAAFLRTTTSVRLRDGRTITPHNAELVRSLERTDKTARDDAKERLRALNDAVNAPAGAIALRDDGRALAQSILARREFQREPEKAEPSAFERAWRNFWRAIGDWLGDVFAPVGRAIRDFFNNLFRRFPRGSASAPNLGTAEMWRMILQVVLVVAAAGLAFYLLWRLTDRLRDGGPRRRRSAKFGGDPDLTGDDIPDPLGAARASADAGDYRSALRLAYIASLRRLQDAGLLVLARDKTNWEYQGALRARSTAAHETLLPVTRDFDRIWYGKRPATAAEFERAVAAHAALPQSPVPAEKADGA